MIEFELFQRLADWSTAQQRAYLDQCTDVDSQTRETVRQLLRLDAGNMEGRIVDDRYRLHRQIGSGVSSEVWLAHDLRLQRHVALKLLDRALSHRARDEARAAACITDPHVVQIYDVGDPGPDQRAYIAMEFIGDIERAKAQTLADFQELDSKARIRAMEDAARGVAAAHRAGITHRDIKPKNIMVDPVTGRAKVADFGLATSSALETHHGGTPPYMAPEQVARERVDHRIDVYGLGATLYHLLAGCPPYCSLPGRSPRAVLARIGKVAPEPLSTLAPNVSIRLIRIVETAMARDPKQRYARADELAQDLEDYRHNRPTSHERRNPLVRLALAIARNKPVVAFVLTILLLLAGSLPATVTVLYTVNATWDPETSWPAAILLPAVAREQERLESRLAQSQGELAEARAEFQRQIQAMMALTSKQHKLGERASDATMTRLRVGLDQQREARKRAMIELHASQRAHRAARESLERENEHLRRLLAAESGMPPRIDLRVCTSSVEFAGTSDPIYVTVFDHREILDAQGPTGPRHFAKGTCRTVQIRALDPKLDQQTTIELEKSPDNIDGGWRVASVELFVDGQRAYGSGELEKWLTTETTLKWTSEPVRVR